MHKNIVEEIAFLTNNKLQSEMQYHIDPLHIGEENFYNLHIMFLLAIDAKIYVS